jgi:ribosome maturation protein SDO1
MGRPVPLSKILVAETVFSDANKGTKAAEDKLMTAFKTLNITEIAETILRKGTLQLTSDQRRKLIEEKRKQIIAFITRQAVDPKTNLPHPPIRIEQALEEVRFSIDPFKSMEEQAKEIIKLLRPVLPLKMEQIQVEVWISTEYAAKTYGTVKGFGTIKREEWRSDGSWKSTVEMPAGVYGPFLDKIGNLTKGSAEVKII